MTLPLLEQIAQSLNYGELLEVWRVPDIENFSVEKTLYDYQRDALEKAARALYLYYGKDNNDWQADEAATVNEDRKRHFYGLYHHADFAAVKKYETRADKNNGRQNPVFRILAEYIRPFGEEIPYYNLVNRICFWMATGSGKTLVMVKLIAYLHALIKHGEIPPHNILILAPGDHLLGQIRRTVAEFNRTGLHIDLVPLRDSHRPRQGRLGDALTVYYHRSDNIADVQKEALTDYRTYENEGRWYVLLDEAHKGGKEDSKRQAYYAVMARAGFLFNFSATFTDNEDVVTTVKKYNLEEFIKNGHGKNIYVNEGEYTAFQKNHKANDGDISREERREIVLQSLITLAFICGRVEEIRAKSGIADCYHTPLMLTLVNSVNTVENDLQAFFQTLREIATGEVDEELFRQARNKLHRDLKNGRFMFGENSNKKNGNKISADDAAAVQNITLADLRKAVFISDRQGAIQLVRSTDKRELALQIKNADAPFALIRIGDTSRWRNDILAGYEETTALQETAFFDALEKSPIKILMGSRSFFESWDSNRPNVINFINIGGLDAKKFVVQSVGRGVRIAPLPGKRRRLARLSSPEQLHACLDMTQPPETLFLFATNQKAIKTVLEGLEAEKSARFEPLAGFEIAARPKNNGEDMPLLIPQYRDGTAQHGRAPFAMSKATRQRLAGWLDNTSDAVFAVRDGLAAAQIDELRTAASGTGAIAITPEKNYAMLAFLQQRLLSHFSQTAQQSDGVRQLDEQEDIVHFRHVRSHSDYVHELEEKIQQVKAGRASDEEIAALADKLTQGEITREAFDTKSSGKEQETFKDLTIKKILNHYYLPVVLGRETASYIQHIIKINSEVEFLNRLASWLGEHKPDWDSWMFSKLDEARDEVYIPYYDSDKNDYRRFLPDFVFWMVKGRHYRIVFVDPKGGAYTSAYHKIDGYKRLFVENGNVRHFTHGRHRISVHLFYYNASSDPSEAYKPFWITDPAAIFTDPAH